MNSDFCNKCGCWIGSSESIVRQGTGDEIEAICSDCLAIEQTLNIQEKAESNSKVLIYTE
ncbi:MAG: hypothetical protein ACETWQ_22500 [Phycisphaerae bacterium]